MDVDLYIALAGLIVGFVVGLTGMGGGALMTPVLVPLFGVQPLAAVSSDLVAAITRDSGGPVVVKPLPTVLIGAIGGLVVGMTSVGSGSLIIVLLPLLLLLLAGLVAPLVWRYLRACTRARAHAAARTQPPETARPGDPAGMRVFAPDPAA